MDVEEFVPFSFRESVVPRGDAGPRESVEAFLDDLMRSLAESGCRLVGHIKGMAACGEGEPLFFDVTSLEGSPRFRGGPLGESGACTLTMNIIVAGVSERRLEETALDAMRRHFQSA